MKQKRSIWTLALVAVMLLTGCGSKSDMAFSNTPSAELEDMAATEEVNGSYGTFVDRGESTNGGGSTVYRDSNAKLIREANLRIQTTKFDEAVEQLESYVLEKGGYFENASLRAGGYRNANANRYGEYTIRIPIEQYESFMHQTGEIGYVTYRNERSEDIGEQYYDTETRLKTQKIKQERLLSLLTKASTMEDIIALETALGDVEYEIEHLSSTLNRYDSLVGFSTIYLTLEEVHQVDEETGVANSLGQRMAHGFASSFKAMLDSIRNVLVWISYNVFGLLIAGSAIGIGVGLVRRKFKKKKVGSDTKKDKVE